jgi:hypothetical protein
MPSAVPLLRRSDASVGVLWANLPPSSGDIAYCILPWQAPLINRGLGKYKCRKISGSEPVPSALL